MTIKYTLEVYVYRRKQWQEQNELTPFPST